MINHCPPGINAHTILSQPRASHTSPVNLNFWYTALYKTNFLTVSLSKFQTSTGLLGRHLFICTQICEYPLCISMYSTESSFTFTTIFLYSLSSIYVNLYSLRFYGATKFWLTISIQCKCSQFYNYNLKMPGVYKYTFPVLLNLARGTAKCTERSLSPKAVKQIANKKDLFCYVSWSTLQTKCMVTSIWLTTSLSITI
jgi:hypothetical protein